MTIRTPAQKGLVTGAAMVLASLLSLYVLKNPVESNFQYIVYLIFFVGIGWSLFDYSKSTTDKKSFKDYFSIGFKTFVVIALIMAFFTFAYFSGNPEFRDSKIAENSKLLIQQGDHLPNEIAANAEQLKKMFMPLMISAAVFRYLISGALITVIAAGFLSQRNKSEA